MLMVALALAKHPSVKFCGLVSEKVGKPWLEFVTNVLVVIHPLISLVVTQVKTPIAPGNKMLVYHCGTTPKWIVNGVGYTNSWTCSGKRCRNNTGYTTGNVLEIGVTTLTGKPCSYKRLPCCLTTQSNRVNYGSHCKPPAK